MSQSSVELEPQLSLQSEPERGHQHPHLLQLPPPTQDPHRLQEQIQLQVVLQQQGPSNTEHQEKPVQIKHPKGLSLILGLIILAAILGLIYYLCHNFHKPDAPTVTPCLSPECLWAENHLSMSSDPFTQPCDYFLSPCESNRESQKGTGRQRGQAIQDHPQNQAKNSVMPARQNKETQYKSLVEDKILNRKSVLLHYLREILESNHSSNSSALQKTTDFYHSCLDKRSIDTAGAEPFVKVIQKLGGWAVLGQWNKKDFNATLGLLMRDYNTFPFFNLYVGKDPNEAASGMTKRYIQIDQPDLLIPIQWNNKTQKSRAKPETLRPFLTLCKSYLALLGYPLNEGITHVSVFISLSSELAVAVSPLQYRLSQGQLHHRMTIKELQRQAPAIDWLDCLQTAFHPLTISEDDHVLLHNLPYIIQMSHIIIKWLNRTNLKNIVPLHTYMFFNLLNTLMPAMDSRFSETTKNYSLVWGNSEEEVPRWKHCLLETERGFDSVLAHLLGERTAHREAGEIIENVFLSFQSKLTELKRTDQKSFGFVSEKVDSLIPKLPSLKEIASEDELDHYFSEVIISTDNFFSNYIQLLSLWQKRRNKLLTSRNEPLDILSVTHSLLDNELLFPMGMFIPPFFHPSFPKAMNYGAVGFLIAKDIFHLLLPEINSHSKTVLAMGKCVWTRYLSGTEKAGRGGVLSLSAKQQQEVWVQHSALQVALQAYYWSLSHNPSDTSISGMYHNQLFLRSFAQVSCEADPHGESMPIDPSFLITVMCSGSDLCPTGLQCSIKPQQASSHTC